MRSNFLQKFSFLMVFATVLMLGLSSIIFAQSRPQRPTKSNNKKNQRPTPKTPEQLKREAELAEEKRVQDLLDETETDDEVLEIKTNLVSVNTVVYNKKTGQIITGLKKENFGIFEDGKKQEIINFAMPESPITVSLVVEYSRWSERLGSAGNRGFERGHYEVIRPVSYFLSRFIKPPNDYASVIAFDMRPTPITDFTNDPNRLRATTNLLFKNSPVSYQNNLYDALKFTLVGGRTDSVVLEKNQKKPSKLRWNG